MFRRRILDTAYQVAKAGPGVGKNNQFKLGACLVDRRGRIVTSKHNEYKTHPILARFTEYPCLHAESNCIISHGLDNCHGLELYVCRVRHDGSLAMSKPCETCEALMREVGISRVYYTTGTEEIYREMPV